MSNNPLKVVVGRFVGNLALWDPQARIVYGWRQPEGEVAAIGWNITDLDQSPWFEVDVYNPELAVAVRIDGIDMGKKPIAESEEAYATAGYGVSQRRAFYRVQKAYHDARTPKQVVPDVANLLKAVEEMEPDKELSAAMVRHLLEGKRPDRFHPSASDEKIEWVLPEQEDKK